MSNRKFVYPEWAYSLDIFQKLSLKKAYAIRFRLEYFYLLSEKTRLKQLFSVWIQNIASVFKITFVLTKFQLTGKVLKSNPGQIVILLARNNVYLQTLKPVILYFASKKSDFRILCPEKHYHFIKGYLGVEAEPYLYKIEAVIYEPGLLKRVVRLAEAFFVSISDGIWFMFQPAKKRFWFAPVFSRFSLIQHYFGKSLSKYFSSGARLISANDHWMWESLYFTAARDVNAQSYVMEHGVIGDITYPLFAKQFLAWGQYDSNKMQAEFGALPQEVRIIGSPHFDQVFERIATQKSSQSQFEKPYITFLSQYFFGSNSMEPGYYQQIINMFCALAPLAESLGKQLVIKLHPSDNIKYYMGLPENIIISTEPLFSILDDTSLAFTVDSTAIFEAMMFGIPIRQCGVAGMLRLENNFIVSKEGYLFSYEEMASFAKRLLSDKKSYETNVEQEMMTLSNYYYDLGKDHSVKRIYDLLN